MYDHALIDRTLIQIARARAAVPPHEWTSARLIRLLRHCRQRMRSASAPGATVRRATG